MKKDFLSSTAKLMGMLFLFFFSFTASELSAQTTDLSPGLNSLVHNGVRYDVDKLLSDYTYVTDVTASTKFEEAAYHQVNLSNTESDDLAQIEARVKSKFYKMLHKQVADGASVEGALKVGVFSLNDIVSTTYAKYDPSTPRPDLIQLVTEAVQLVAL